MGENGARAPATTSNTASNTASNATPNRASSSEVPAWIRRGITLFFGRVVALVAAFWLVTELRTLIAMLLVALFLSLAMEPAVDRLARRGWRRGSATLLVLTVAVALTLGFVAALGSVVVGQTSELFDHAPRYVREMEHFVNTDLGIDWNADGLIRDLRHGEPPIDASSGEIASSAIDATLTALGFLLQLVTALVFAFYMTADGPRMRRAICSRLPPRRQEVVLDTWEIAIDKTGGYLYSRGIQAVVSAVTLDVPVRARGPVRTGTRHLGRRRLPVHPHGRDVPRDGAAHLLRLVRREKEESPV